MVVAGIGGACKLFLQAGARTSVVGREHMAAAMERPPGVGLITVSNHVGSIDDPLITSSSESEIVCLAALGRAPVAGSVALRGDGRGAS